ncbi:GGDEF domain-containing protein [Almyronema epifaneia]|uniref:GGDEF domain-containing protein n=1 Tax=Almyronema epifaneia S1 TaxID=2991925 RepID=A0ABW6IHY8_9CYAN
MLAATVQWLEKQSWPLLLCLSFALCLAIGCIDYLIREDVSLSIFYLVPITLAAWFIDRRAGFFMAAVCAMVWLYADTVAKNYPYPLLPYWNAAVRLGFFVIVTHLLGAQKQAYEREKRWARIDGLTGVFNHRFFLETLQAELDRARRYHYPITLAYLDLDNFKQVNDHLGHAEGDRVLLAIAQQIKLSLRTSDVVARLGGDEFALLLPQVEAKQAQIALTRLHEELMQLSLNQHWPVGFSIGAVTAVAPPQSAENLIHQADQLMYTVKQGGKNRLKCETNEP